MKKIPIIIAFLFLLTACTVVATKSDNETQQAINMPVPEGKSVIYIVRPSFVSYSNRHYNVLINGQFVGKLGSSHFFAIIVEPGQYLLTTKIDPAFGSQLVSADMVTTAIARKIESILDDGDGILIKAQQGQKYYARLSVGVIGASMEVAKDSSIFTEGMFSDPSLVDTINFGGKGLRLK